jgi:multisubunit Na+/H+ antiporter MnhC subunit
MNKLSKTRIKKFSVVLAFALLAQALCWSIMVVGQMVTSIENTLIAHAIGAPIIAIVVSTIYYKKFNYTTPLQTALVFVSVVIAMDVFVVALLIEKSFEMFASPIGTWIPISSIFLATYLTGLVTAKQAETTSTRRSLLK